MERAIDLNKSVYELCAQYPELVGILQGLGFSEITKPGMLATVGRFVTISKGAAMRKVDIASIKSALAEHGYSIEGQ